MSLTCCTGGSKAAKVKEREGTLKIFEGVEKYMFTASIAAIDHKDCNQIQDFALNWAMKGMMVGHCSVDLTKVVLEGWKFGMWNQHGVEMTHMMNLAECSAIEILVKMAKVELD
ncbi:hypothetical protein BS47DRAFT_1362766 [Hydnum rufescens UP504]|uniref:Uncharacterized protein n=1 Tax=Hydnum rufescens UP504 TaxID=1448309 RepID=A0A9P6DVS5_9AGAM|nr:hypothetical protein BS47DRAFT_1362766 [Hydnum rufescens UP504]